MNKLITIKIQHYDSFETYTVSKIYIGNYLSSQKKEKLYRLISKIIKELDIKYSHHYGTVDYEYTKKQHYSFCMFLLMMNKHHDKYYIKPDNKKLSLNARCYFEILNLNSEVKIF